MTPPRTFDIRAVADAADLAAFGVLLRAYLAALPIRLDYQDIDDELAGLPGKYAPPAGALLLARDGAGAPAGCVALRPLPDTGCCEMKRLYATPAARGGGLGRALAEAAIAAARARGYAELKLDTLAGMDAAKALYARMGFVRIAPYYGLTPEGTVFMALRL